MHTEEEAKQKWCPMARTALSDPRNNPASGNRSELPIDNRCLGSECAAWRWASSGKEWDRFIKHNKSPEDVEVNKQNMLQEGWVQCQDSPYSTLWERQVPRMGYCGLAGKE